MLVLRGCLMMLLCRALFALNNAVKFVGQALLLLFEACSHEHIGQDTTQSDANEQGGKYNQRNVRHIELPVAPPAPVGYAAVIIDGLQRKTCTKSDSVRKTN